MGRLSRLKSRGFEGVKLIIADACMGLSESAAGYFPDADWQRCIVHFHRNVANRVPSTKVNQVAKIFKAMYTQESLEAAQQKASDIVAKTQ